MFSHKFHHNWFSGILCACANVKSFSNEFLANRRKIETNFLEARFCSKSESSWELMCDDHKDACAIDRVFLNSTFTIYRYIYSKARKPHSGLLRLKIIYSSWKIDIFLKYRVHLHSHWTSVERRLTRGWPFEFCSANAFAHIKILYRTRRANFRLAGAALKKGKFFTGGLSDFFEKLILHRGIFY